MCRTRVIRKFTYEPSLCFNFWPTSRLHRIYYAHIGSDKVPLLGWNIFCRVSTA